jgi:hypothetical protein
MRPGRSHPQHQQQLQLNADWVCIRSCGHSLSVMFSLSLPYVSFLIAYSLAGHPPPGGRGAGGRECVQVGHTRSISSN